MLAALLHRFSTAPDDGWSFRVIGNAVLESGGKFGLLGADADSGSGGTSRVAELAWRVVDLTQRRKRPSAA